MRRFPRSDEERDEVTRLEDDLEAASARLEEVEFLAAAEEARLRAEIERLLAVAAAAEARAQQAMAEVQDWRDRIVSLAEDEASAHEMAAAVAEERERAYDLAVQAEIRAEDAELRATAAESELGVATLRAEEAERRAAELALRLAEAEARAVELEVPASRELELELELSNLTRERDVAIAELLATRQEVDVWRARALAANPSTIPGPPPVVPGPASFPPEPEEIDPERARVLFETAVEAVMFGRTAEGLEILRNLQGADPNNDEYRSWILQAEAFLDVEDGDADRLAMQSQWLGS